MRKTIEEYAVVWPSEDTCNFAMELLAEYHLSSGMGIIDALIGQLALDMGLPLHTSNKKHYENVQGLDVIEPYQKITH
jgi:predicted nucleic acid-binding protein